MNQSLNVAIAQINVCVGDFEGNTRQQIISSIERARDKQRADIIVFPELAVTGYPPEDLLYRPAFLDHVDKALTEIATHAVGITVVIGAPGRQGDDLYNQAVVFEDGKEISRYSKQNLPNYRVFDEKRYFTAGNETVVIDVKGTKAALLICEDIWQDSPIQQAKGAGADMAFVLNASPFRYDKMEERLSLLERQSRDHACPIVYCNLVGGQDELVFDGQSMIYDAAGQLIFQAPSFEAGVFTLPVPLSKPGIAIKPDLPILEERMYNAIVLGVRDYVQKNGFPGVMLGLSGGIDSALTLAIAVDALGAENVEAVMMPFRYTADISIEDARKQAETLGVKYREIPIEPMFDSFMNALAPQFEGLGRDTTEENIQARSRGVLLMAMSNKLGKMLLATGNKSEMSVGYATLYGDMAGGFAPLKDVFKLWVYRLSEYRNSFGKEIIPQRVIDRPPSAELAPDQKDEDSLPPYEDLDVILKLFIEEFNSVDEIIAKGYDNETVHRVANLVLLNEYKRRQAAPGVRISVEPLGVIVVTDYIGIPKTFVIYGRE